MVIDDRRFVGAGLFYKDRTCFQYLLPVVLTLCESVGLKQTLFVGMHVHTVCRVMKGN